MKFFTLTILSIVLFSTSSFALIPPKLVKDAFASKFPTAIKVKWEMEKIKVWEAEFMMDGKNYSATFKEDGTWLETEKQIEISKLPERVKMAINIQYGDWKIAKADLAESEENGQFYEVDLKKGVLNKEVSFHEDGTVVMK